MNDKTNAPSGLLRGLWRFLASLKLTVVLLLCLAVLSVIGTVIPQNASPQVYVDNYGMFGYQVFVLLDVVDMYHSWWFVGLLLMLVVNIVICSIDRLEVTWQVIFPKERKFNLETYRKRKSRLDLRVKASVVHLQKPLENFVSKKFRFCRSEVTDNGFVLTAEKGRWTRLGVYVVHLSVVVLLLGGLIGSRFGFEGFVNLPEGDAADEIQLNRSGIKHTLPFTIRCDDFNVQFYEGTQRPKEFRSTLVILEDGKEVMEKQIVVNGPLLYKGIGIYQSSYGRMEGRRLPAEMAFDPTKKIELSIRSTESGIVYTRSVALGKPLTLPEGLGQLTVERYEPAATFKEMDLGPSLMGRLVDTSGKSESITLPLKFPRFDAMRRGTIVISASMPANTENKEHYYTGLQVVYDPGVGVVYAGFVLMILGCVVTFFMSHQQLVVEVTPRKDGAAVMLSGKTNKNKMGYRLKLQRFADQLASLADANIGSGC